MSVWENIAGNKMDKRNIMMTDIMQVLMWGDVEEIEPDDEGFKCRISGKDVDDNRLVFIASFCKEEKYIHCITVF